MAGDVLTSVLGANNVNGAERSSHTFPRRSWVSVVRLALVNSLGVTSPWSQRPMGVYHN